MIVPMSANSSSSANSSPPIQATQTTQATTAPPQRPAHPTVALPTDQELVLKVIPMPGDCNANGDIFGGWVMAQVDLAGSVVPARYAHGRMATVAVNEFIFKQPVRVGDILSFFSKLTRIGRTSITVKVEVYAERFGSQGKYTKVTEASLTYVAIDDAGQPREVPKISPP
jgi:acyl-CoA thioesterase YciA